MTEHEVLQLVRERIFGQSEAAAARSFGMAQGYFSLILRGKAKPSKQMLKVLGLMEVVKYRAIAEVEAEAKAAKSEARTTKRRPVFRYGDWPVGVR